MKKKANAFTIVELLIVIVVIAILAAISIVAYTGIQQRANNTAIKSAASQAFKAVQAYIASEDSYPLRVNNSFACITTQSGCAGGAGSIYTANATFDTNMQKTGSLTKSVPTSGADRYGVTYHYDAARTLNGEARPAIILYYLQGTNQQCGLPATNSWGQAMLSSTTGYTTGNTDGKTSCFISIPGPSS